MDYLILYSSKYGATKSIVSWIKERLDLRGDRVSLSDFSEYKSQKKSVNTLVLATPIYGGRAREDFYNFLKEGFDDFIFERLAIFGVAMNKKNPLNHDGNLKILEEFPRVSLMAAIQDILLGEMIYSHLDRKDKESLDGFYHSLNLSKVELEKRLSPRTLLSKKEAWDFAEKL